MIYLPINVNSGNAVCKQNATQIVMHTRIRTSDVSLAIDFQKHLYNAVRKHGVIDKGEKRGR